MKTNIKITGLILALLSTTLSIAQCTTKTIIVNDLNSLNIGLNELVSESSYQSTTVIIENGEYGNEGILLSDLPETGLWRDIDPKGGCPCEVKAETDNEVNLYGKLLWRIQDAKNLTIRGINFIKTRKHIASGLIDIAFGSDNITIDNCNFLEGVVYPKKTGSLFPGPLADDHSINYYINIHGASNSVIKNSKFLNKKSNGHYINNRDSDNSTISNCTFLEAGLEVFHTSSNRNFILSVGGSDSTSIKNCAFSQKDLMGII